MFKFSGGANHLNISSSEHAFYEHSVSKPFGLKMASECYIRGSSRYHQWEGEMGVGMWGCGWCLAKMKSLKLKVHDIMTG